MFAAGTRSRNVEPSRMRRARALAGAVACTMCSVAAPITPTSADDFTDFRIPSNRTLLWTAGLHARATGQDASSNGTNGSLGSGSVDASSAFSWFSDSDPSFTRVYADLAARGQRLHQDTQNLFSTPPSSTLSLTERSIRDVLENWTLGASTRRYPWAAPLGFEIGLQGQGDYSQNWDSQSHDAFIVNPGLTFQNTQSSDQERWTYLSSFAATAAAGWGRVRSATGIYDALVLEQRLRETGALTRPLSSQGRQRLADVLYLRGSLDTVRERPGRTLWREIERVLAEDGALEAGGLDPYSVLRAAEPHLGASRPLTSDGVPISPVPRLTGYFAGVRLLDRHSNSVQRMDAATSFQTIQNGVVIDSGSSTFASRVSQPQDFVDCGPTAEFHRPLDARWQIDAFGDARIGLRAEDNYLVGDGSASLAWLAADRWTASASTSYTWTDDDRTEGATPGDYWAWAANLNVDWYLEDRTSITFSAGMNQGWIRGDPSAPAGPAAHIFVRNMTTSIGLNYRFTGWIATPGFFPAGAASPRMP
jgi:hypothetical protein